MNDGTAPKIKLCTLSCYQSNTIITTQRHRPFLKAAPDNMKEWGHVAGALKDKGLDCSPLMYRGFIEKLTREETLRNDYLDWSMTGKK